MSYDYVTRVCNNAYVIEPYQDIKHKIRKLIQEYLNTSNEQKVLNDFKAILQTQVPRKLSPVKGDHKTSLIIENIDITPANVLDIGAGDGTILLELKKHYRLDQDKVFALELQPIVKHGVTVINYVDGKIPMPDGSVDLIVMFSLLHHIQPDGRVALLKEVRRVVSPNGRVIIREHDNIKNKEFYIMIQLIHYIWYIRNGEHEDPLIMMSRDETKKMFADCGFVPHTYIDIGSNKQRIYCQTFKPEISSSDTDSQTEYRRG